MSAPFSTYVRRTLPVLRLWVRVLGLPLSSFVITGLDPVIHASFGYRLSDWFRSMDPWIKSGGDEGKRNSIDSKITSSEYD
jgi:hypothetical protein